MPNFDGFYAIEKILQMNSKSKILVLTGTVNINNLKKLERYHSKLVVKKLNLMPKTILILSLMVGIFVIGIIISLDIVHSELIKKYYR